MKNKLMKVSLLLFLMALIAGKSLSQNQPVRIKAEHPRLILSSTDIELMRGNALSGIEPWKTAWKKLESEIDGYADEKWKPNVYREMPVCLSIKPPYVTGRLQEIWQ